MHGSPMLTDYDHDVARGQYSNITNLQIGHLLLLLYLLSRKLELRCHGITPRFPFGSDRIIWCPGQVLPVGAGRAGSTCPEPQRERYINGEDGIDLVDAWKLMVCSRWRNSEFIYIGGSLKDDELERTCGIHNPSNRGQLIVGVWYIHGVIQQPALIMGQHENAV